jgi:hypothetical protein
MRIRLVHKPLIEGIDGIDLRRFQVGTQYEVGNSVGALLLAEGWAEPVPSDEPAILIPLADADADIAVPSNLIREVYPPYYDTARHAADRHGRRRRKSSPRSK